jgi:hypothetical protein
MVKKVSTEGQGQELSAALAERQHLEHELRAIGGRQAYQEASVLATG